MRVDLLLSFEIVLDFEIRVFKDLSLLKLSKYFSLELSLLRRARFKIFFYIIIIIRISSRYLSILLILRILFFSLDRSLIKKKFVRSFFDIRYK